MSGSPHILKNFIEPLAICSTKADLETLLEIIRSSQHPIVAVVDETKCPVGIINGHRLLLFILKQRGQVSQGTVRATGEKEDKTYRAIADSFQLDQWIEPIVSLPVNLSLEEIIAYFQTKKINQSDRQNYLVIETTGNLLGQLNTFRLSQWLFSSQIKLDSKLPQHQNQKVAWLNLPIFQLIEQLPLPLMLQTGTGVTLYQNQSWRQQVGKTQISNPLEISQFVRSFDSEFSLAYSFSSNKKSIPYCLKGNYYQSPSFSDSSPRKITLESQKILDKVIDKQTDIPSNHLEKQPPERSTLNFASLPIQKTKSEWQYLKLPLNYTESNFNPPDSTTVVWLLIALQFVPTEQLDCQSPQDNELQRLNQLKDNFLNTISHELKSPLTSIVGLSSLLKEEKLGKLNQRQIRYSELIYSSGRKLMKIVSDILELTHLATGKQQLNFEVIQIKSFCLEVYEQVLTRLEESNQMEGKTSIEPQFQLSISQNLELISADKMRLRQMLVYLLDNAFKFVREKKSHLSTLPTKIAITVDDWHDWIAISIIDDGIGIAEEIQTLILEQYFSDRQERQHRYNDIALGLVMAQQLAKAHGGNISFISSWGKGSKFTVLLPSASTKINLDSTTNSDSLDLVRQSLELSYHEYHSQADSPAYKIPPQDNLLVLIIDSVVSEIELLDLQLNELGYHPIVARTPTEAFQKARQFKPSKILLNPTFSNSADNNILKLLKSDALTSNIPLFLLVNNQKERAKYTQADGFSCLPIEKESLMKILPPVKTKISERQKRLTILHLYPESEITSNLKIIQNSDLNFALNEHLSGLNHRVLEADSLEQGELLARIWQIDAIVLDGRILQEPILYLRSLKKSEQLSYLPLVTLDIKTTEAANQIEGLAVFPCLLPEEKSNLANLVQVIQIAAGIKLDR